MSIVPNHNRHNGNHHSFYPSHLAPSDLHQENKPPLTELGDAPSKYPTMNNEYSNVNNNCHAESNGGVMANGHQEAPADDTPTIDIIINNVVCTFNTKCHLNLKKVATEGAHVEYRRENGMLNMKLRHPSVTASIWSSGKITCTGSTSEESAKLAARRIARRLQKLGFSVRFTQYRVVNVLGTCSLPFGIRLNQFSSENRANASFEPEIHPGVTYRLKEPRATLKIFSTGSITVTAPCVLNVQLAIEHIYPLVDQFKMPSSKVDKKVLFAERKYLKKGGVCLPHGSRVHNLVVDNDVDDDDLEEFDESDMSDDFDSDISQD